MKNVAGACISSFTFIAITGELIFPAVVRADARYPAGAAIVANETEHRQGLLHAEQAWYADVPVDGRTVAEGTASSAAAWYTSGTVYLGGTAFRI